MYYCAESQSINNYAEYSINSTVRYKKPENYFHRAYRLQIDLLTPNPPPCRLQRYNENMRILNH